MKFSKIKNTPDNFTDEYQILRRCPDEIYYYEKQRMFEQTLGVDDIRSLVNKMNRRVQTSQSEVKFTGDDLENYSRFLDTLKVRLKV